MYVAGERPSTECFQPRNYQLILVNRQSRQPPSAPCSRIVLPLFSVAVASDAADAAAAAAEASTTVLLCASGLAAMASRADCAPLVIGAMQSSGVWDGYRQNGPGRNPLGMTRALVVVVVVVVNARCSLSRGSSSPSIVSFFRRRSYV